MRINELQFAVCPVALQVGGAVLVVPFDDSMAEPIGLLFVVVSMLAAASKPARALGSTRRRAAIGPRELGLLAFLCPQYL